MRSILALVSFLAISCSVAEKSEKQHAHAAVDHPVTAGIARITDGSRLFSLAQQDSLLVVIQEIERTTGAQIGIYTLDTLHGRSIEEVSREKAAQLGLGRKDADDGILITIARNDRRMRLEIGEGLENIISDERAAQLIRDHMLPDFRRGLYFKGTLGTLLEIGRVLR